MREEGGVTTGGEEGGVTTGGCKGGATTGGEEFRLSTSMPHCALEGGLRVYARWEEGGLGSTLNLIDPRQGPMG